VGAVEGAAEDNFGAVSGQKRAVILQKSSREGSEGPGNPVYMQSHASQAPSLSDRVWFGKD
jgi:hypothetical protein